MYSHFIGQRITQLWLEKDISEYQLSLELGLSKSYIQGITSGKSQPSVKQLLNICDYFGITPAQFFDTDPAATLLFHETVNTLKGLNDSDIKLILNFAQRIQELTSEKLPSPPSVPASNCPIIPQK